MQAIRGRGGPLNLTADSWGGSGGLPADHVTMPERLMQLCIPPSPSPLVSSSHPPSSPSSGMARRRRGSRRYACGLGQRAVCTSQCGWCTIGAAEPGRPTTTNLWLVLLTLSSIVNLHRSSVNQLCLRRYHRWSHHLCARPKCLMSSLVLSPQQVAGEQGHGKPLGLLANAHAKSSSSSWHTKGGSCTRRSNAEAEQ